MDARKWSELLGLVEKSGNVSQACERLGVSRSLYYKWRKLQSPKDGSGEPEFPRRPHPHSIPDLVKVKILFLARSNPDWGCDRISYLLELGGSRVSAATVHKLLIKSGLRKRRGIG